MVFIRALTFLVISVSLASSGAFAFNPLEPVKTDTPQDTMMTFMKAMEEYRKAVDAKDKEEVVNITLSRAIRTLDLSRIPIVIRQDQGKEAAIFLKEVIDRIVKVDYEYIPPGSKDPKIRSPWRLINSEIKIVKIETGERKGEYLFSHDTVSRIKDFYRLLKDKPFKKGTGGGASYKPPWMQEQVPQWFQGEFFGVRHWQLVGAFLAIFLGLIFRRLIGRFMEWLGRWTLKSDGTLDDKIVKAIRRPVGWIGASAFWFICMKSLRFEGMLLSILGTIIQVIFSFALIWVFYRLASVLSDYMKVVNDKAQVGLDAQLIPIINKSIRIFVVIFGTLIAFQSLGVNVMSILAGLGLGGLAFALAAKDTAANLFGSVMIFSDSPFRVGEWVKFGGVEGTVESVGFRSTKVRTFYNSVVTVPNATVANAAIDNMGRRKYRRVYAKLGLTYSTSAEQMEAFLEGTKNIIKANPHTWKDSFHVAFSGYGDSALEVMVYFFLKVPDWSQELIQRQNVYLEILRLAADLGVDFAFPSQSLYVESMPQEGVEGSRHDGSPAGLVEVARSYSDKGANSRPSGMGIFTHPSMEKS